MVSEDSSIKTRVAKAKRPTMMIIPNSNLIVLIPYILLFLHNTDNNSLGKMQWFHQYLHPWNEILPTLHSIVENACHVLWVACNTTTSCEYLHETLWIFHKLDHQNALCKILSIIQAKIMRFINIGEPNINFAHMSLNPTYYMLKDSEVNIIFYELHLLKKHRL